MARCSSARGRTGVFLDWHAAWQVEQMIQLPHTFVYVHLLAGQCCVMLLFFACCYWVDLLPWFGFASSLEEMAKHSEVLSLSFLPWRWGEVNQSGLLFCLFNIGYLVSFVCALGMNHFSTSW